MFLPKLATRIFPEWNEKVISDARMFEYCRDKKVRVVFGNDDEVEYGCYTIYNDLEWIVLNKNLDPEMLTWVFSHEIYHCDAHSPLTSYFSIAMDKKNDAEANIFAAVCMMPKPLIYNRTVDDICGDYGIPRRLAVIRKLVSDNYEF